MPDTEGEIVMCWVWSWNAWKVEAALKELVNKSLLGGREDYLDACDMLLGFVKEELDGRV